MSAHRMCCCDTGNPNEPRMIRAGWYHYAVLDAAGAVTVLIGDNRETRLDNYSEIVNCEYESSPQTYCVSECVPVVAPAWHPLSPPTVTPASSTGVRTLANPNGKGVVDIACGAYTVMARHDDGTVSVWGLNSLGQCNVPTSAATGNGNKGNLNDPTNAWVKKIVGLHAGYSNCAVTFNDGTVCCWGDNGAGLCDLVNGWTDISMSPVHWNPDAGQTYQQTDNTDPAKPQYAKPEYSAAYNTDANLFTWNIDSDRDFYWHRKADNRHCLPMFDLGCEVNPTHPIELVSDSNDWPLSFNTAFPGWPLIALGAGFGCGVDGANAESSTWKDWLGQRWRNQVLQSDAGNQYPGTQKGKSCCDLEVKADFAVAIRRTGQVITSRTQSGHRSAVSCPTGHTDGRSACRDCSADKLQSAGTGIVRNPREGCGSLSVNDSCYAYPDCQCCTRGQYGPGDPGVYVGCPTCINYTCDSQSRFRFVDTAVAGCGGFGSCENYHHEGVGCISTIQPYEDRWFAAEWATPKHLDMSGRWVAGVQVRFDGSASFAPSWNDRLQENYGWSTLPAQDAMRSQQKNGIDVDTCVSEQTLDETSSCGRLCKNSSAWEPGAFKISNSNPTHTYPPQMLMQSVVCGVNTTAWLNQAMGFGTTGMCGPDCAGCSTFQRDGNLSCAVDTFQGDSPNGGWVTYGTIYSGKVLRSTYSCPSTPPTFTLERDKYHATNAFASGAWRTKESCQHGGVSMYYLETQRMPSKPWGPFHLFVYNGVGNQTKKYGGNWGAYPSCYCCNFIAGGPGDGNSDTCDLPNKFEGPGAPRVAFGNSSYMSLADFDGMIGTIEGMPAESNMICQEPIGDEREYPYCPNICQEVFLTNFDQPSWTGSGPPFCHNNPPRSVATGRMSMGMIRTDHRRYDENGNKIDPPGRCGAYPCANDVFGMPDYAPCDDSQAIDCTAPQSTAYASKPVTGLPVVVHIWGSLWDPCPPWGRKADCAAGDLADPPADTGFSPPGPTAYRFPCDASHPEYPPVSEANPASGDYLQAKYPPWTRRPSSNTTRSIAKGKWVGTTWTLLTGAEAGNEKTGPDTSYAPSCENWTTSFWYAS